MKVRLQKRGKKKGGNRLKRIEERQGEEGMMDVGKTTEAWRCEGTRIREKMGQNKNKKKKKRKIMAIKDDKMDMNGKRSTRRGRRIGNESWEEKWGDWWDDRLICEIVEKYLLKVQIGCRGNRMWCEEKSLWCEKRATNG